jgi:hypothetical protein
MAIDGTDTKRRRARVRKEKGGKIWEAMDEKSRDWRLGDWTKGNVEIKKLDVAGSLSGHQTRCEGVATEARRCRPFQLWLPTGQYESTCTLTSDQLIRST